MAPTYTVKSGTSTRGIDYWVVTIGPDGHEYAVTLVTKVRAQAEEWCKMLNRAAQVNEARREAVKGKRRTRWR